MTTPPDVLYRLIPLTKGQVAIVDEADHEWLSQWKWYAKWDQCTKGFYAARNIIGPDGRRTTLKMHRLILGLPTGDRRQGDHANCNTLDNRRYNLRLADHYENSRNRRMLSSNTSGFKGVSLHGLTGKYQAYLSENGSRIYLGLYSTKEEAFAVVNAERDKRHKEFARAK